MAAEMTEKYVRIKGIVRDAYVEFDFAIGDPTLFVELVLPITAFQDFCDKNQVKTLSPEQCRQIDKEMEKWRYGEDTLAATNKKLTESNHVLATKYSDIKQ